MGIDKLLLFRVSYFKSKLIQCGIEKASHQ